MQCIATTKLAADAAATKQRDPRLHQIASLLGLLLYGMASGHLDVGATQVAVTLAAAQATQLLGARVHGRPFDPRSAWITGLSLSLLLRTMHPLLAVAGACLAIGSKLVLRWRGRHVFNPAAFALIVLMLATDGSVWVSPGQWGSTAFFGFLLMCAGGLVVHRAQRSDVTATFLVAYVGLVGARAVWLGDPWAIPLHHLENGALLLFAFFMISDPKTTPASRGGRMAFAAAVAVAAFTVQFSLYRPNGLIWSLVCLAPLVPILDRLHPDDPYEWPTKIGQRAAPAAPHPPKRRYACAPLP